MVIANHLGDIRSVPAWLKHAPDTGLTFVDVIAPAFLFVIGLTYRRSYENRLAREGRSATVGHFARRWFALIGIGAVISAGEGFTGVSGRIVDWGVLQAIGVAGLLTLPLLRRHAWVRLAAGILLLAVYQVGFELFLGERVLAASHGGMWGSLSWTAVVLLSTLFGDLLHPIRQPDGAATVREDDDAHAAAAVLQRRAMMAVAAALGFLAGGLLLGLFIPISKPRVSASYALASVGITGLAYLTALWLTDRRGIRAAPLVWWGRNPLLLYVLHYILLGLVVLPGVDWWYRGATAGVIVGQAVCLIGVLTAVAWGVYRRAIVVRL